MIRYDEYLVAVAVTLARRHRPIWSRELARTVCRCGSELPCRVRESMLRRNDWPAHRQLARVLTEHTRGPGDSCTRCRMASRPVDYPCGAVTVAVRTFAEELADRILDGLP
jgi:hypothetical protein